MNTVRWQPVEIGQRYGSIAIVGLDAEVVLRRGRSLFDSRVDSERLGSSTSSIRPTYPLSSRLTPARRSVVARAGAGFGTWPDLGCARNGRLPRTGR